MSKARQIDDLTPEEIKDIEEYRKSNDIERKTLQEIIEELNG